MPAASVNEFAATVICAEAAFSHAFSVALSVRPEPEIASNTQPAPVTLKSAASNPEIGSEKVKEKLGVAELAGEVGATMSADGATESRVTEFEVKACAGPAPEPETELLARTNR